MPNPFNVTINELDLTFSVAALIKGISGVMGVTKRGPVGKPDEVITGWTRFQQLYGGFSQNTDFPLLCYRALTKGCALRVNKVGHYTDVTDESTLTLVSAELPTTLLLTFDDELVNANTYNADVNGSAIGAVNYAVSSDSTMAAIAAAFQAMATVESAQVVPATSGNVRKILIKPVAGTQITITGSLVTGGASQATTSITNLSGIVDNYGNLLLKFKPKYSGQDYNNITITIAPASNGSSNYFNLVVKHILEPAHDRTYPNLIIPGTPDITSSSYLVDVVNTDKWVDVEYVDLSPLAGWPTTLRPSNGVYQMIGGSDGGSILPLDYLGSSSAQTGVFKFNNYSDMMQIAAPEISDDQINEGLAEYAKNRKDLMFFAHLDFDSNISAADFVANRTSLAIDSSYTALFAGGLRINHPVTNAIVNISEIADILALAANSDFNYGEHYSFAADPRGVISNVLGVVRNFGGPGQFSELTQLANAQINVVAEIDNKVMLYGNYTAQLATSQLSFIDARRYMIFIRKSLMPTLRRYIQQPNDIPTWSALFKEVEPFFIAQVDRRAIYPNGWRWLGDQDATDINQLEVNDPAQVGLGKYKAKLFVKKIGMINEIELEVALTPTSANIDEV